MPQEMHYPRMGKKEGRKPFKYVRIKDPAGTIAESAAQQRQKTLATWVTEAVIEKLEREGLWPPPPPEPKTKSS